jgi:hypothetical protein
MLFEFGFIEWLSLTEMRESYDTTISFIWNNEYERKASANHSKAAERR